LLLLALFMAGTASSADEASAADAGSEASAATSAPASGATSAATPEEAGGTTEAAKAADPTVPLTPDGGEPYPELHVPDDGWRYVTDYFFALTLGLEQERLADWVRYTAMVGTVPADVLTAPGAALAGLFGP